MLVNVGETTIISGDSTCLWMLGRLLLFQGTARACECWGDYYYFRGKHVLVNVGETTIISGDSTCL